MQIRLKVEHTHDDVQHSPGDVIDVDPTTGKWLIDTQIGEAVAPAAPAAPAKADKTEAPK